MIKLYKYLSVSEFIDEFSGLDNTDWADEWQALGVLYYYLDEEEENSFLNVRDWLRFEVMEMTAEEIEENYSLEFVGYSDVDYFLSDYTVLFGSYESDGKTYYLFCEF